MRTPAALVLALAVLSPQGARTPDDFFEARKKALASKDGASILNSLSKSERKDVVEALAALRLQLKEEPEITRAILKEMDLTEKDLGRITPAEFVLAAELRHLGKNAELEKIHVTHEKTRAEIEFEVKPTKDRPRYETWVLVLEDGVWVQTHATPDASPERAKCEHLIEQLTAAANFYELDWAKYPTSGNANLAKALASPGRKKVPYFEFEKGMLNDKGEILDPWGRPLVYHNNSDKSAPKDWKPFRRSSFDLYSFGRNGKDQKGCGDDPNNWD